MKLENAEVLVIGAGPSGCVSAAYLHNNGVKVKVVEKTKFPRLVIGESLIPRVMDHFDEAGLFPALDAKGYQKKFGARFIRGKEICLFDFSKKFSQGWDWTWQVPRADFDNTLVEEVIRKGVDVEFETEVIDVSFSDENQVVTVKDKTGNIREIQAKFVIDASGYGRVLPRLLNLNAPSKLDDHSSIFSHVKDINRPEGSEGTLISFDILEREVWLWVIPFSDGNTSIGVVGPTHYINSLSSNGNTTQALKKVIRSSDFYRNRFENVDFLFEPHKIESYSCSVKQLYGKGYVLTGNSTEFLDPVFSSGVAFATESGMLAAKLVKRQLSSEKVDWEKEYSDYMKRGIAVFTSYVKEWYTGNLQTLFFHQPENPEIKEKICSVLAGYVWDEQNNFVKKHNTIIESMAYLLENKTI
ncbi:NAD(P)/FAD-dependent oxidoreductase [Capnocytophaga catalasegens]|uniref:Dehydrogenase/oxidoreductase n=1 Tax=Capnocytophaga catalasegens TaxID=1004260 RepID=A0AAV5ATH0_9FLAO|nr:NAD(P)/FAD-dependent oxidoreductase [Capnocytophaga catalasegens]GIZ14743.1 dehydrogenase/oxidoreductase [Capnocytophaga catalasegens]GJM50591.1 dehydrogenase/oxidoreductase [Capnocytophaga catalasegens]GJM53578.1 dehydrogenase/oxidoreductase [Capnocytophaga catalasegens]